MVDRSGLEGLKQWAQTRDAEQLIPLLVLDRNGQELLQRQVSPQLLSHLQRHINGREGTGEGRRTPVLTRAGDAYWLIPDIDGLSLQRLVTRPHLVTAEILLATLIGGLVCLLLARYITAPIERLQRAAQAYGEGDFSQRVRPPLGSRRDEIVDLAATMDGMAEKLEALLASKRLLLRDVSHELRSPLARVQAALGLARQRQAQGVEAELDRIEREADRLNDLIGGILSFSRLDSGARPLQREQLRLDCLIADTIEDLSFQAENSACKLNFSHAAGEVSCSTDQPLLYSALENVLSNALRYAPGEVDVSLAREAESYLITVADHGPGVPEALLEQIFEPFVRVDASRASKNGGVGLGLAIARKAIKALGGSIEARNRPDGGLQVYIRIPI